ncbi:MAG: hypothetical protein KJO63_08880 [Maribacter sp.]|nr:hypothetical protein [Maribacter sp.]
MKSMVLTLVLVFTINTYGQFKKVDIYTASNGTLISTGDAFEIGLGSAKEGAYLYITMKPNIAGHAAFPMKKGKEGKKFKVELIRKLKNPIGGLTGATIIFKAGKARYLVDIENAIRTKEIIFK